MKQYEGDLVCDEGEKNQKKMLGLQGFTMQTGQATGPGAGRLSLGTFA